MFILEKLKMKKRSLQFLLIFFLTLAYLFLFGCVEGESVSHTVEAGDIFDAEALGYTLPDDFDHTITKTVGTHRFSVTENGKKLTCILTVVDTTAPTVEVGDIRVTIGEGVAFRRAVNLSDNSDGEVKLSVDSSAVDTTREGVYVVKYTATDPSGNSTTVEANVYVSRLAVSDEMLFSVLDPIIEEIIEDGMTNEQKCRAIYAYLEENLSYKPTEKSSDSVYSAYVALSADRGGDCFSFFSVSKAFFDRLGIENVKLSRTEGYVDGSHYWNLVNIGTADAPLWYHFDSSPILGEYSLTGCLLTDAQIEAYDAYRGERYRIYDTSAVPKSATDIITDIPEIAGFIK
jgi:hypothetical protein